MQLTAARLRSGTPSDDRHPRPERVTYATLAAGLFSQDEGEIQAFFERIDAGVVYGRAGATTGAWPGVQPFGGWKGSGTTGKASGGAYYVQQFMREQSRTRVRS